MNGSAKFTYRRFAWGNLLFPAVIFSVVAAVIGDLLLLVPVLPFIAFVLYDHEQIGVTSLGLLKHRLIASQVFGNPHWEVECAEIIKITHNAEWIRIWTTGGGSHRWYRCRRFDLDQFVAAARSHNSSITFEEKQNPPNNKGCSEAEGLRLRP